MHEMTLKEKATRRWMFNTGKGHRLEFTDAEIAKLKECFKTLDEDKGGAIGIEELEMPLIGLGFA